MNLLPLVAWLLVATCSAAPSSSDHVISKDSFLNKPVIYSGKHDIVNIYVPLKQFHAKERVYTAEDSSSEEKNNYVIFFVEADLENGQRTDQGLYVYKNEQATKLLDNGRDVVETHENVTYIGATDGLYKYNEAENKAEKVGTINDNIIQLAHNNKTNDVYYLTENHELFKLNNDATSSVKVANVKNAQKVVFGFEGNLYYFDSDNNVYVLNTQVEGSVPKKVEDLPSGYKKLAIVSPMFGLKDGAFLVIDGTVYFLESKATVYKSLVRFSVKPTAYAPQATLTQYYAIDKKIYEVDSILTLLSQ